VGLRAGLDTEVRGKILSPLPGIEPRSPGLALGQTLPTELPGSQSLHVCRPSSFYHAQRLHELPSNNLTRNN
jgi:hypothetical protein